jgi:hypothetical protein
LGLATPFTYKGDWERYSSGFLLVDLAGTTIETIFLFAVRGLQRCDELMLSIIIFYL